MPYHRGHSRALIQPYYSQTVPPSSVSLTDTPSAIRHGGPDGSLSIDLVITDTPSAVRCGGPQGSGIDVSPATDSPSAIRHGGPDGSLSLADVYTDTPSALRCGGPAGALVVDLAVTDTPSALRCGGPDGQAQPGVTFGPDTPSATRCGGPDGLVSPDLAVTDTPSGLRHGGPDGALALGVVLAGDSPSAIRHAGPSGSVFADIGGGVTVTDSPSATRHGGADGVLAIGVTFGPDTPSATRYGGPDGLLAIGVTITGDSPSAIRYGGPVGFALVIVGGTDSPSATRYGGPDGAMGIVVPIVGDSPSATRYGGPVGVISIGVGADVIAGTDSPGATRYGGPDGQVLLAFLPTRPPYVSPAPISIPGYSLWVADTVTGRMLWELPLDTMSWSLPLGQIGTITATIDIEKTWDSLSDQDERDPRILVRELLSGPWRFCLVVVYGSQPVWAGPYISMSRPLTNSTTASYKVQLGGAEISKIFSKRVLVKPGAIAPADVTADTVIGPSTSKAHAAYTLISQALSGTGKGLPITVSDPGGAGIDYRVYPGYDLTKYADALANLSAEVDGPEIRYDPVITAGTDANYLSWVAQIGNPYLGQGVAPWTFDDDVSGITALNGDAASMVMNLYSAGSGSSRDKLIAQASDTSLLTVGYPLLEDTDTTHSAEVSYPILSAYASATVAAHSRPAPSLTLTVPADRDPMPGTYHLGENFQMTVQDDPVVPDGVYTRRIAGIAGTEQPWVTITDAPLPGPLLPLPTPTAAPL